jgi:putative endonuclease
LFRRDPRPPKSIGADKEQLARLYLEGRGLQLMASNYRCRRGEIDLVMRDAATLVFVEVRYRASSRFGTPAETVDRRKQQRLAAAAGHYIQRYPTALPCRFDVLAISGRGNIDWIRNAFEVD